MRVLVVGAGSMGRNHVRNFSGMRQVREVLVVEPSANAVERLKEMNLGNVVVCKDLGEALEEKIDAATVAVPTAMHYDVASKLLDEGIDVLVEKPIAASVSDGKKLVEKAGEKKKILMVGHIERFNPAVQALKKHVGQIGKIVYASAHRFGVPSKRRLGDSFYDQAVHDIDVISFISGEKPLAAKATSKNVLEEDNDLCSAIIRFPSFCATVEANRVTPIKTRELILLGLKGSARLDYISQELVVTHAEKPADYQYSSFDEILLRVGKGTEVRPYFQKDEPLKLELEHFLDCVKNRKEPVTSALDGVCAVAAAEACIRAAKSGKEEPVSL